MIISSFLAFSFSAFLAPGAVLNNLSKKWSSDQGVAGRLSASFSLTVQDRSATELEEG